MVGERIYLDYNATAPVLPHAREQALTAIDTLGNPSSVHQEGRANRALVEGARDSVASLAGCASADVIFTSGGTEAAILALRLGLHQLSSDGNTPRLLLSAGEHPCVIEGHELPKHLVQTLPLNGDGIVCVDTLRTLLSSSEGPAVVAIQAANNETGVIQPVSEAAAIIHEFSGVLVCDAVQSPGKMDFAAHCKDADFVAFSSHKLGGVKGAGALLCLRADPPPAGALLRGGGQERGLRGGTENVVSLSAFGAACAWIKDNWQSETARLGALRDAFENDLRSRFADAIIFGDTAPRLANTSSFALPGLSAETALIALDLSGIAVSSGSACSSGKVNPSHVLEAMGVESALARGAIRVSLGHQTTQSDMENLLAGLERLAARIEAGKGSAAA